MKLVLPFAMLLITCTPTLSAADQPTHKAIQKTAQKAPATDQSESVEHARRRMLALFDFPISRAIGIDVEKMVRPAPKIYHFTVPFVR